MKNDKPHKSLIGNSIFIGIGLLLILNRFLYADFSSDVHLILFGMGSIMVFLGLLFIVKNGIQQKWNAQSQTDLKK